MIIDEIKIANINAMKNKDMLARGIYSVVMNKVMQEGISKRAKGEVVTDADVVAILQKTLKELSDEKENYIKAGNSEKSDTIALQQKIIEKFLPAMMSKDEIKAEILKLDDKSMPSVMKHFKANFAGKCDMRDVGEVLKTL